VVASKPVDARTHRSSGPNVRLQSMVERAEATEGNWPKSYLIPSILLSLTAAGFLAWHVVDPARHIDGWAITLFVVGFLPWLRTVFESIDFPGGGSVTWRKAVEKEQRRQAQDIEALQLLTANFFPVPEREMLQWLASGVELPLTGDGSVRNPSSRTRPLVYKGLIAIKRVDVDFVPTTINQGYEVTARGRKYLELIAKLPADSEQVPDP
jgi:hypothetical protein